MPKVSKKNRIIRVKDKVNPKKNISFNFSISKKSVLLIGVVVILFLGYLLNNTNIVDKIIQLTCNEVMSANLAKKATVLIKTEDGSGSGFFIDKNIVVTNNHVVEGIKKVKISLSDGLETTGEVIGWDNVTDIALIKTHTNSLSTLRWRFNNLRAGENIIALGFPFSTESFFKGDASITKGVLSAYRKGLHDIEYIQTDATINSGNSGGPIVDKCGYIVGVSDLIVKIDERSQPVFYGIALSSAKKAANNIISNPNSSIPEGTLARFEEQDPIEVVKEYYGFINYQYYKEAYQQSFTTQRRKQLDWQEWTDAFSGVSNIIVESVEKIEDNPKKVKAKLKIYRTDGINNLQEDVESTWLLKYNTGYLRLDQLETKTISTKALFSDEYITNIRKVKVDTESSYSYISSKDLSKYPNNLISRIKQLMNDNLTIIRSLYKKIVINSEPLTEEDTNDINVFISQDNEIRSIQKQLEEIDWNNYINSLYR